MIFSRHYLLVVFVLILGLPCAHAGIHSVEAKEYEISPNEEPKVIVTFRTMPDFALNELYIEWTANGTKQNPVLKHDKARCVFGTTPPYSCAALEWFRPASFVKRPIKDHNPPQAFYISELEFDTEYCFHFANGMGGKLMTDWTPWACTRTRSAPEVPPAPKQPQITILPEKSGRGEVGTAEPTRVLVEWNWPKSDSIGFYRVEYSLFGQNSWESRWHDSSSFETTIPFSRQEAPSDTRRYEFRVCAGNISGKNCSQSRSTAMGLAQEAKIDVKMTESGLKLPDFKTEANAKAVPSIITRGTTQAIDVFAIRPDGEVLLYKRAAAKGAGGWSDPVVIATGWPEYRSVLQGDRSTVYALTNEGVLHWYHFDGIVDGNPVWQGPVEIATGWEGFVWVIPGGEGVFYALKPDGTLAWLKHTSRNGENTWLGPMDIGRDWNFRKVFSGGSGVLYAITENDQLFWYKHEGFATGEKIWSGPKAIGGGWAAFRDIFSTGNGDIYAIAVDGSLRLHKHTGFADGSKTWEEPVVVGWSWHTFQHIAAMRQ